MPVCFNVLNLLLAGNLPPFGAACVIAEDEQGRFLMVRQSRRSVSLPGGFMRWRETPMQAVRRECKEETGLDIDLREMIGTYSNSSSGLWHLSTLTVVYTGTVLAGGTMRGSVEGQPCWLSEA
ncbi:MAG TPA: NUDIX hydrolase, partial [Ktedonobacteraceae bacterium]|nr:NUDIX hydrolase [Ktedonobacteraceae bacterium]